MSTDEIVHYAVDRAIATITLDSPANRNALSTQLVGELSGHLATAAADDDVRAIVLTHTGTVFCAGADLKERKGMSVDDVRNRRLRGYAAYNALEALPMPAIAVVHGAALCGTCAPPLEDITQAVISPAVTDTIHVPEPALIVASLILCFAR